MPNKANRFFPTVDCVGRRLLPSAALSTVAAVVSVADAPPPVSETGSVLALRSIPARRIPLSLTIGLAPEDRPRGHIHQKNSGGFSYLRNVTIEGRTTPGSLIRSDPGIGNFTFQGPSRYADANGDFAFPEVLSGKLTNTEFLITDPFGQHLIRAFPIRRLG